MNQVVDLACNMVAKVNRRGNLSSMKDDLARAWLLNKNSILRCRCNIK
jgi:ferredoxin